jgi:hypothetical protein
MKLSQLSSSQLGRLAGLMKKKEALGKRINAIQAQLHRLLSGHGKTTPVKTKSGKTRKRRKRGQVTKKILALLKTAGPKGLPVQQIATQLKKKPALVFAWYYASRKKLKGLKKVAPGRYAYSGSK